MVEAPEPEQNIVDRLGWLGVSEDELRRRLVRLFSFDPNQFTLERLHAIKVYFDDYKKPTRGDIAKQVTAEIKRIGATQKRPKVLAGAVVKRVYATYPDAEAFKCGWRKVESATEQTVATGHDNKPRPFSRHGRKNRWFQ